MREHRIELDFYPWGVQSVCACLWRGAMREEIREAWEDAQEHDQSAALLLRARLCVGS